MIVDAWWLVWVGFACKIVFHLRLDSYSSRKKKSINIYWVHWLRIFMVENLCPCLLSMSYFAPVKSFWNILFVFGQSCTVQLYVNQNLIMFLIICIQFYFVPISMLLNFSFKFVNGYRVPNHHRLHWINMNILSQQLVWSVQSFHPAYFFSNCETLFEWLKPKQPLFKLMRRKYFFAVLDKEGFWRVARFSWIFFLCKYIFLKMFIQAYKLSWGVP